MSKATIESRFSSDTNSGSYLLRLMRFVMYVFSRFSIEYSRSVSKVSFVWRAARGDRNLGGVTLLCVFYSFFAKFRLIFGAVITFRAARPISFDLESSCLFRASMSKFSRELTRYM